jgi:hypothetical protein
MSRRHNLNLTWHTKVSAFDSALITEVVGKLNSLFFLLFKMNFDFITVNLFFQVMH